MQLLPDPGLTSLMAIVGDFNIHHPLWDHHQRMSATAEETVARLARLGVGLITPPGVSTWSRGNQRRSTLDLLWASPGLGGLYRTAPWDLTGSDHTPQLLHLGAVSTPDTTAQRQWRKVDGDLAAAEAAVRLSNFPGPGPLSTPEEIDSAFTDLHDTLQRIATISVPVRAPPGGRRVPWWDSDTDRAVRHSRQSWRRALRTNNLTDWEEAQESNAARNRTIRGARRKAWRSHLGDLDRSSGSLWKLHKWSKSAAIGHAPDTIPPLARGQNEPHAITREEKGTVLATKFFPPPVQGPHPIRPTTEVAWDPCELLARITPDEISITLASCASWNAPGPDGVPYGFLKTLGKPLHTYLAEIFNACLAIGHFPARHQVGLTVVLQKPNKAPEELRTASGWRPITLLNTVGKLFEKILADRIALAAETHRLLPEGQMGNRRLRSTETAIVTIVETIRTAWARGGFAALLQLDIAGAFDNVDHFRLVSALARHGFPESILRLVESFLASRSTRLRIDGGETKERRVRRGVPQGSPLSPILFILFTASLYTELGAAPGLLTVGFADDTNLLGVARSRAQLASNLRQAWEICEDWSHRNHLTFSIPKFTYMPFRRGREPSPGPLRLGQYELAPQPHTRLLGVWLTPSLSWKKHVKEVRQKVTASVRALRAIVGMSWGPSFLEARGIYLQGIRPIMTYGLAAWHTPGDKPQGPARALRGLQANCLRVVTGAFRATNTHHIEVEAQVPPLDLYLTTRKCRTVTRWEATGAAARLRHASAWVASQVPLQRHQRRQRRLDPPLKALYTDLPGPGGSPELDRRRLESWLTDKWINRWEAEETARQQRARELTIFPAHKPPWARSGHWTAVLNRHPRHITSLVTQMRTGKIGLNAFLHDRRVPGFTSPLCRCGTGPEDIYHIALTCSLYEAEREPLPFRDRRGLCQALDNPASAVVIARWLFNLGRLSYVHDWASRTRPGCGAAPPL